jgi:uncharacterized SAM-binding protein YcdF (DUF218 family)
MDAFSSFCNEYGEQSLIFLLPTIQMHPEGYGSLYDLQRQSIWHVNSIIDTMKRKSLWGWTLLLLLPFFSSCFILERSAKRAYGRAEEKKPFDAIIVTGYPFKNGAWGKLIKARVLWSYVLYKNGYARNIIYSGGANYTPFKEAVIMGLYAEKLGIPKAHIFYDTLARHSTENVYYSYLLAKRKGFKTLALASDGMQTFFLKRFIRKHFESPVYRLPTIQDSINRYLVLKPVIDPTPAKVDSFTSIDEGQNLFKRIFNPDRTIDWSKYKNEKVPRL